MTKFLIIAFATLIMTGCSSAEPEPATLKIPFGCVTISEYDSWCGGKWAVRCAADPDTTSLVRQKKEMMDAACEPRLSGKSNEFCCRLM